MSSVEPERPITVVAADPSPMTLLGLANTIRDRPELDLVAHAGRGDRAIAIIREQQPRVAIVDAHLDHPDGCEIARVIRAEELRTRALIIAEHHTGDLILQAITAGAAGFLSKRSAPGAIIAAIRRVADGGSVLPSDIGPSLAQVLTQRGDSDHFRLTERELDVLRHIAQGQHSAVIARELGISVPTVKTHTQNLYIKLGVNDRGAAVAVGIRRGLLT